MGSKWNATFWVVSEENLREQRNIEKGSPVFPNGMFQTKICVPFQAIIDHKFQALAAVF